MLLPQVEQRQLGPHLQGLVQEQLSPHWPQAFLLQVLQVQEESQLQFVPQEQPSASRVGRQLSRENKRQKLTSQQ